MVVTKHSRRQSGLAARFATWLQTEIPLNFRTLFFCFLVGSLLSVPCGFLVVVQWELYEPPLWTAPIYCMVILLSLVVLPFWSVFALRDQPMLRRIGQVVSVAAFTLFALCLLFPALNSIR